MAEAQPASHPTQVEFHSSDSSLDEIFQWARGQALAYVAPSSSSIGPWYEAALPGRNAFCMRDVSHQTEGAAVLGLAAANRNMLGRFAASVDEKRDWAGYWEIDGEGRPSSADYVSDADFWFNLPANFDVLDAIVRMWRWTGDDTYRDDSRFREFFRRTVNDYVTRWQLQPEKILHRPRIANQRLESGKFVHSRGIPSYSEGPKDFIFWRPSTVVFVPFRRLQLHPRTKLLQFPHSRWRTRYSSCLSASLGRKANSTILASFDRIRAALSPETP